MNSAFIQFLATATPPAPVQVALYLSSQECHPLPKCCSLNSLLSSKGIIRSMPLRSSTPRSLPGFAPKAAGGVAGLHHYHW